MQAEHKSLDATIDDQPFELGYRRHNALEAAKYAQWESWEEREANQRNHMDDIMCAMHERHQELESRVLHYRDKSREWEDRFVAQERRLEWANYQIQEGAAYAQWECEGFAEEGFVEVDEYAFGGEEEGKDDEGGYASSETLQFSETEDEVVGGFEGVFLEDVREEFEKVSHFTDGEETESDNDKEFDLCVNPDGSCKTVVVAQGH